MTEKKEEKTSKPFARGRCPFAYFVIYYRNGKVVKATSSIQSAKDVKTILKDVFA